MLQDLILRGPGFSVAETKPAWLAWLDRWQGSEQPFTAPAACGQVLMHSSTE